MSNQSTTDGTWYPSFQEAIRAMMRMKPEFIITGEQSAEERQAVLDAFDAKSKEQAAGLPSEDRWALR